MSRQGYETGAGSEDGIDIDMDLAGEFDFLLTWGLVWDNEEVRSRATGPADLTILWFQLKQDDDQQWIVSYRHRPDPVSF